MKNSGKVETIDKSKHAKLRVRNDQDYEHAKAANLATIALSELGACTSNYPVVFVQNPVNNQYRLVAILGLRPGENVYYAKDGWDCTHVPLTIQSFPFMIGFDDRVEEAGQFATCLDLANPMVSESEGIALFNEKGEETEFMQTRHLILNDIFQAEKIIAQFAQQLLKFNLLTPLEIIVQPEAGEPRRITGMLTIDQAKLKELNAETLVEMHKSELLPVCYLLMGSVFQYHRLIQLHNRKGLEKIGSYQIDMSPPKAG